MRSCAWRLGLVMLGVGVLRAQVAPVVSAPAAGHASTAYVAAAHPYQYHYKDIEYLRPSPEEAKIPFAPRLAVDYMETGALAWTAERECVACHTNGTYMVARPLMMEQLGPPSQEIRDFFVAELRRQLAIDPAKRSTDAEPTQVVYLAAGLAIWDAHVTHRLSPETAQALALMFQLQRPEGDWPIADDNNPPLESSPFQLATVAADYDRTDLLWAASEWPGLLDAGAKQRLIAMIFAHQREDGGWSIRTFAQPEEWGKGNRAAKLRAEVEFVDPPSDGHMTGLAIIALRKAGVRASDARIRRGVQWLLTNQRSSGRWWTRSLNRDGWQFISYSGTVYPLLALSMCGALPVER
jgi:squalene-hopene/tetraprenyl-beta-curcumene cyclase